MIEANGAGTGIDTVLTSVSYSVAAQFVEYMRLLGTGSINAVGNNLVNVLVGNAGNNRLDGRGGADAMAGQAGNDTYFVDNPLDRVSEGSGQGTDLVHSSVSKAFSTQFIERITLVGAAHINTTGNFLANAMVGNNAQNALDGGRGSDTLTGNGGNDLRIFDRARGGQHRSRSDFSNAVGNDDRIVLDNSAFPGLREGPLTSGAFQRNTTGLPRRPMTGSSSRPIAGASTTTGTARGQEATSWSPSFSPTGASPAPRLPTSSSSDPSGTSGARAPASGSHEGSRSAGAWRSAAFAASLRWKRTSSAESVSPRLLAGPRVCSIGFMPV